MIRDALASGFGAVPAIRVVQGTAAGPMLFTALGTRTGYRSVLLTTGLVELAVGPLALLS